MEIAFSATGVTEASYDMLRFADRADDMTDAFVELGGWFRTIEAAQFESEGSRSTAWAPLQPATLARKIAQGMDVRILRATEDLYKSLAGETEDTVTRIGPDEAFFGTTDAKAVHHQYGAPRAKVPRRAVVDLTEQDRRNAIKVLQAHLVGTASEPAGAE